MTRRIWSDDDIALLRAQYPTVRAADIAVQLTGRTTHQVYGKAAALGLKKTQETIVRLSRQAMANPDHPGRVHQFKKGQSVWNKGMKGLDIGGKDTRFKPGQKPHTWNPIGHERITEEGYRQRKLTDTGVTRRDYVNVHHLVWIELRGQIPPGYVLIFRDGDPSNIVIDNLECITRGELMRRNSYHNYPKEIAQLIQLRGALNRKINHATKKEAEACPPTPSPN